MARTGPSSSQASAASAARRAGLGKSAGGGGIGRARPSVGAAVERDTAGRTRLGGHDGVSIGAVCPVATRRFSGRRAVRDGPSPAASARARDPAAVPRPSAPPARPRGPLLLLRPATDRPSDARGLLGRCPRASSARPAARDGPRPVALASPSAPEVPARGERVGRSAKRALGRLLRPSLGPPDPRFASPLGRGRALPSGRADPSRTGRPAGDRPAGDRPAGERPGSPGARVVGPRRGAPPAVGPRSPAVSRGPLERTGAPAPEEREAGADDRAAVEREPPAPAERLGAPGRALGDADDPPRAPAEPRAGETPPPSPDRRTRAAPLALFAPAGGLLGRPGALSSGRARVAPASSADLDGKLPVPTDRARTARPAGRPPLPDGRGERGVEGMDTSRG